ncbi:MAG: acetoacetate decarboxylase family protein [Deltaproteobacteria bacterium]|nr:acetoacetate decarboxylase family protein [Deltaproteobacteria bacterium]
MGFVKSDAELAAWYELRVRQFPDVKMLGLMFNLDEAQARRLLPEPLENADVPGGLLFIAEYGTTNLGPGYREAALFLRCAYQGVAGNYCLSMPIDSEPARLHNGRDIYGFPKKAATISCSFSEQGARGSVERCGVRFLELSVERAAPIDALPPAGPTYLFKAMPRADLTPGFDGPVLLVRQQTEVSPRRVHLGTPQLTITPSALDPWHELHTLEPVMGFVLESENRMLPGEVLGEVDAAAYLPHWFRMTDFPVAQEP